VINDPTAYLVLPVCQLRPPGRPLPEIIVSGILEIIQQQLSGGGIQQVAQHAGVDPLVAQRAADAALPIIVGALGENASQTAASAQPGAGKFGEAEALLGGLSSVLGSQADGAGGIFGKIIGSRQDEIVNAVVNATGIDKDKAARIIQVLVPIVMAALASRNKQAQARPSTPEARPGS
jgi:hypothetical protein